MKYSTARMAPWSFSFSLDHRRIFSGLIHAYQAAFVFLVCHDNCLVVLDANDLRLLLGPPGPAWISVRRSPRSMCVVSGSGGDLYNRVADADFSRIHQTLAEISHA